MKRLIIMAPVALTLAGCASYGDLDEDCEGFGGPKSVTLYYDEDGISIKARTKVQRKSLFIIRLKPSKDFRDKEVKTVGISVSPNDAGAPGKGWLNNSGKYSTSKWLVYCAPELTVEDKEYEYKYSVEIEDLGILDPRIGVTW